MKLIVIIVVVVVGIVGGGIGGLMMKPAPTPDQEKSSEIVTDEENGETPIDTARKPDESDREAEVSETLEHDYVKIGKQTIVPVVEGGETRALMMFELAVDVALSRRADVVAMEPRLRDVFLRELFKMSYTGAFTDNFTNERVINELRQNLYGAAKKYLGDDLNEILILDVIRQEL